MSGHPAFTGDTAAQIVYLVLHEIPAKLSPRTADFQRLAALIERLPAKEPSLRPRRWVSQCFSGLRPSSPLGRVVARRRAQASYRSRQAAWR